MQNSVWNPGLQFQSNTKSMQNETNAMQNCVRQCPDHANTVQCRAKKIQNQETSTNMFLKNMHAQRLNTFKTTPNHDPKRNK
jgi:hypothetical protein